MDWPLASDFCLSLQRPQWAFSDPALKVLEIEKNANRQPKPRSGAFANVYKGTDPSTGEMVAIRVFTSANPERRERYQAISDYLSNRRLESLVQFSYRDDGIKSPTNGKRYPLVTMEWVRGEELFRWAQERCDDKDTKSLAKISELWLGTIHEMHEAHIAHGDLQHANVMVTDDGRLKLVDYDCMCVPSLVGRKNLEIGVDPYQHPDRNTDTLLGPNLDNFSALFIFVALRALAAAPDLWTTYVTAPVYDKLLFRREDFQSPTQSALIQSLGRSPDKEVRRLTKELVALTSTKMDDVPALEDVLFSYANVESLLNQRDFDAAIELLARNKKQPKDAPPALRPRLQDAQQRIKLRLELERAVNAGDEAGMARSYSPQLLDDYPRALISVKLARESPRVIPILKRLEQAKQAQKWRDFVREWNTNQSLLAPRKSAAAFVPLAKVWHERNQAWDALFKLLQSTHDDSARISSAWEQLQRLGGHPESDPYRSKIDQLLERGRAWNALTRVAQTLTEASDIQLVAAWKEPLFAGWDLAERERPRVEQADRRLKVLKRLQEVTAQPVSRQNDEIIRELGNALPRDFQYAFLSHVTQSRDRSEAFKQFEKCLASPVSDIALDAAWRHLEQAQGGLLLSAAQSDRVALAQKRLPLLKQLKQIPADYPPQQAAQWDSKLLAVWHLDLLADCADAQPWAARQHVAAERRKVLESMRAAIAAGDKLQIVDLAADPSLQNYALPAEWTKSIKLASTEVALVRGLLGALQSGEPSRLQPLFDAKAIRKNSTAFKPRREQLLDWMRDEILPAKKMSLGPALARQSLVKDSERNLAFRIAWNWPEPRFCDECVLAVSRHRPGLNQNLTDFPAKLRMRVERRSFEEGGGCRVLHAEEDWLGCYVLVWAVVDLGFGTFNSEPVVLGRLELPAQARKKSGLFG